MDTWHSFGSDLSFRPAGERGTDATKVDRVDLAEVRYIVRPRGAQDLRSIASTFVAIAVLTVIAVFAIATSTGWSVLDPWSG
jgi:hypothetical protein